MNVIGEVGMSLGAFVIFVTYHAVTYGAVFAQLKSGTFCPPPGQLTQCLHIVGGDSSSLELAAFLLLVGAVAKSAQLPLHTWLPDAMEGPTPVSALIHAATMVTAGVYLIGRMHPIYDIATYAHTTVAIVGAVTALFAATIAIVQTDIKRVLAYSTMSQIGYMFLAVGIGAYAAGFFHLLAHAFFKALLFMAAGNVIHAMHDEQDMRKFGGLFRQLPRTSWSFLIGSLALAAAARRCFRTAGPLRSGQSVGRRTPAPSSWVSGRWCSPRCCSSPRPAGRSQDPGLPGAPASPGRSACSSANTTSTRSTTPPSCARWTASPTSAFATSKSPCSTGPWSAPGARPSRERAA